MMLVVMLSLCLINFGIVLSRDFIVLLFIRNEMVIIVVSISDRLNLVIKCICLMLWRFVCFVYLFVFWLSIGMNIFRQMFFRIKVSVVIGRLSNNVVFVFVLEVMVNVMLRILLVMMLGGIEVLMEKELINVSFSVVFIMMLVCIFFSISLVSSLVMIGCEISDVFKVYFDCVINVIRFSKRVFIIICFLELYVFCKKLFVIVWDLVNFYFDVFVYQLLQLFYFCWQ